MDLRLDSYEQDDDTDEGGEILENDDDINRKALEEKRKQRRNCKIYQVGDILTSSGTLCISPDTGSFCGGSGLRS